MDNQGDDLLSLFAQMAPDSQMPSSPVAEPAVEPAAVPVAKSKATAKASPRRAKKADSPEPAAPENITSIDICTEMKTSFLEYAFSVIYARALPDARDGLKPVQRRIIYMMDQMGVRPDKGHVKSSSVVGEVMGKLHPHGDSAIYETLVRLAQDFNQRIPVVDGHGNFGSLDDGPAAARYTEVRQAEAALEMVQSLKEDVVDFEPNYDNRLMQPSVLPAGFPNLLVNGASGIAVGMATSIPPHNLRETIGGAIHLLYNPEATVEDLMRYVPGPDFPGGGEIIGLDGIRDAYTTGRGSFKTRATCTIERVTARKQGLVITELPYMVGPEKVIEKIKEGVSRGVIKGVSNVTNLTDRDHQLRLVVEVKNGFNPQAVLNTLYKHTPMESNFGINAVALVNGQPQTLGLKQMLQVFIDHRMEVVLRRCNFRLARHEERLHLVEGLLIAVLDIDDVISIIRSSEDVNEARSRLMTAFDLDEIQADHILSLQLRRLTKFSRLELESERDNLIAQIAELRELIEKEPLRRDLVASELQEVAERHGDSRRTVLKEADAADAITAAANVSLELEDEPCQLVLGTNGLLARFNTEEALPRSGPRNPGDGVLSIVTTSVRATVGAITRDGKLTKLNVMDTPALTVPLDAPSLTGGVPIEKLLGNDSDNPVVALVSLDEKSPVWWAATARGVLKRIRVEVPSTLNTFEIIALEPGDYLVGAGHSEDDSDFVMITDGGQLLRTPTAKVRPQGRSAAGVAGMKVPPTEAVIAAQCVPYSYIDDYVVVTIAGKTAGGHHLQSSAKCTPLHLYPVKGRAGQGVRCQRFLKGEDSLVLAAVVQLPARASNSTAQPVELPDLDQRRDASGTTIKQTIATIG